MRKMNYISVFFGILLLIAGILKYNDMFYSMEFHWGELSLTIPNSMSMIFIFFVNFIGGMSMIYHSLITLNFDKNKLYKEFKENENFRNKTKPLSVSALITGYVTMIVSSLFIIKLFVVLSYFENSIQTFLPLIFLSILNYGVFSIVPIIVVTKNISLNNKIKIWEKENFKKQPLSNQV